MRKMTIVISMLLSLFIVLGQPGSARPTCDSCETYDSSSNRCVLASGNQCSGSFNCSVGNL